MKSYAQIVSYDSNKIQLKRIKPSYCEKCGRKHDHQNPYIILCNNGDIRLFCGRNTEGKSKPLDKIQLSKNIIQDIKPKRQYNEVPFEPEKLNYVEINKYEERYIRSHDLN
jgi:hypothetical protein